MSTRTITFTLKVGGVLTNATSAVLSDPTGTFGVKRDDTDAAIVADGTAMTHSSTGVYSYTFTEPAAGLAYTSYVEWVYGGETYRVEKPLAALGTNYAGRYTTESAVEQYLGTLNLDAFGDVDDDGDRDPGAVQQAIISAEARVDYYRGGPFTIDDTTAVGAQLLELWSRKLAAVETARKRQGKWVDLDALEAAVIAEMQNGGALPGVDDETPDDWSVQDAPIAVGATVDREGRTINTIPVAGLYYDANLGAYRWG